MKKMVMNLGYQTELKRGEKRNIKIILEGEEFDAIVSNMLILQKKYSEHCDIVRILYSSNQKLTGKLQEIFHHTLDYCLKKRDLRTGNYQKVTIPIGQKEYLVLYTTTLKDVFVADCITMNDREEFKHNTKSLTENHYANEI